MPDYTDLKRRLMEAKVEAPIMGSFTGLDGKPYKVAVMEPIALAREAAAAIAALEAEVARWRVRVERIQAELIARGADSVGDEASAYNDAALALRVLLDSAALADQPVEGKK